MKRSGSTLQYQLTAHLVELAQLGQRIGWTERFSDAQAQAVGIKGWKVYKNHNYEAAIGAEMARGAAKGLYVYRDLRDVFVSFMYKQEAPFDRLWKRDILRELIEQYDLWTAHPQVLVSRYETLMEDVAGEVRRIATHLEIPIDAIEADRIAAEYAVDKQIERIENAREVQVVNEKAIFDKHHLLHENHISEHQGQVGQWRDSLTTEQASLIVARYGDWLQARGYALT
jgi:hypothetical protein